jgi:hypothetical protein
MQRPALRKDVCSRQLHAPVIIVYNSQNTVRGGAQGGGVVCFIEARVVAIDAATVFVATGDHIASFQRETLPAEWWRRLKSAPVNGRVAELIDRNGVPATTPFAAVPLLRWPADSANQ